MCPVAPFNFRCSCAHCWQQSFISTACQFRQLRPVALAVVSNACINLSRNILPYHLTIPKPPIKPHWITVTSGKFSCEKMSSLFLVWENKFTRHKRVPNSHYGTQLVNNRNSGAGGRILAAKVQSDDIRLVLIYGYWHRPRPAQNRAEHYFLYDDFIVFVRVGRIDHRKIIVQIGSHVIL